MNLATPIRFIITTFIFLPILTGIIAFQYVLQLFTSRRKKQLQPFKPRGILITGGSNGLGAALAREYASPSTFLALVGRDERALLKTKAECETFGARVEVGILDVSNSDEMRDFMERMDSIVPLDLIIANAGVSESILEQVSHNSITLEDKTRKIFNINVNGVLNTVLPLIERLKLRRHGKLVIVSSIVSYMPTSSIYATSKMTVRYLAENLRRHLEPFNVDVVNVSPGWIDTGMAKAFPGRKLMMVSPDSAAQTIRMGIDDNKNDINFPVVPFMFSTLIGFLPYETRQFLSSLFSNIKYLATMSSFPQLTTQRSPPLSSSSSSSATSTGSAQAKRDQGLAQHQNKQKATIQSQT